MLLPAADVIVVTLTNMAPDNLVYGVRDAAFAWGKAS
jgi:hypothetical protein